MSGRRSELAMATYWPGGDLGTGAGGKDPRSTSWSLAYGSGIPASQKNPSRTRAGSFVRVGGFWRGKTEAAPPPLASAWGDLAASDHGVVRRRDGSCCPLCSPPFLEVGCGSGNPPPRRRLAARRCDSRHGIAVRTRCREGVGEATMPARRGSRAFLPGGEEGGDEPVS